MAYRRKSNRRRGIKRTFVYFIRAVGVNNAPIKIGITNDLDGRLRALQTGSPHRYTVVGLQKFADRAGAFRRETALHRQFAHLRLEGEWFKPGRDLLAYMHAQGFDIGEPLGSTNNVVAALAATALVDLLLD